MRVSDNRYLRELRQLNLAERLIEHGARTHWICAITSLTPNAVRNLVRTYKGASAKVRSRGTGPTSCHVFFHYSRRREAGALAGLATLFGLLPERPVRNARKELPGIEWGERLCTVFELFGVVVPKPTVTMELFLLLVTALAEGRLKMGFCIHCQATIVVDPLAARQPVCDRSRSHREDQSRGPSAVPEAIPQFDVREGPAARGGGQQALF